MDEISKLGGFALLEDLVWASLAHESNQCRFSTRLCSLLALERINLPFLNCRTTEHGCFVDLAIDRSRWNKADSLIRDNFDICTLHLETRSVIASVFPHHRNPQTAMSLLRLLSRTGIELYAVAQSYSALSVLMSRESLPIFTETMFEHFRFRSYPTFMDWKTRLTPVPVPREIVASYQEKRPKVYSLEWCEGVDLVRLESPMGPMALKIQEDMAAAGASLVFLSGGPGGTHALPVTMTLALKGAKPLCESRGEASCETHSFAVFTMNGPHFGDRYGIAAELLGALDRHEVEVSNFSCSKASITGTVPGDQVVEAVKAIKGCFDVPSIP